jgi:hypothetical protein
MPQTIRVLEDLFGVKSIALAEFSRWIHRLDLYHEYPAALDKFIEQIYKNATEVTTSNKLDTFLLELSAISTLFEKLNTYYNLPPDADSDFEELNQTAFKFNFDYLILLLNKNMKEPKNVWDLAAARLDCLINFKKDPSNPLYLAAMLDIKDKLHGSVKNDHSVNDPVKIKMGRVYVSIKNLAKWQLDRKDPLTPEEETPIHLVALTIVQEFFNKCRELNLYDSCQAVLEIQQEHIMNRIEHDKNIMDAQYTRDLAATLNSVLTALTKADDYQQATQSFATPAAVLQHLSQGNNDLRRINAVNEKAHIDYVINFLTSVANPSIIINRLKPVLDQTSARLDSLIKFKKNPSSLINLANVCEHVNKAVKYLSVQDKKEYWDKTRVMLAGLLDLLSQGASHMSQFLNHLESAHTFVPSIVKGLDGFSKVMKAGAIKLKQSSLLNVDQVKFLRPMTNSLELIRNKPNNIGLFNLDHSEVELTRLVRLDQDEEKDELLVDDSLRSNRFGI